MKLKRQHKAAIIAILSFGLIVFLVFTVHLKKHQIDIEILYEVNTELSLIEEAENNNEDGSNAKTNQAFNEDQAIDELLNNLKTVSKADLEHTQQNDDSNFEENSITETKTLIDIEDFSITESEKEEYKKLQADLKKQKNKANQASTFSYYLEDRTLIQGKTPRYLCEYSGKIVVDISVNSQGLVIDSKINTTQGSSTNGCLRESALAYAKKLRFSSASQELQQGTITYFFKGK